LKCRPFDKVECYFDTVAGVDRALGVRSGAHEERLIDEIFNQRQYVKYARPVLKETDALNVEFGIALQQIIDVVSRPHSSPTLISDPR